MWREKGSEFSVARRHQLLGRGLDPGVLNTGQLTGVKMGPGDFQEEARRDKGSDPSRVESWERGSLWLVCAKRQSETCGERAEPTGWQAPSCVLPRSIPGAQEEATPPPTQGKREDQEALTTYCL